MLGFESFHAAANVLAGIELMHMIRKGQMAMPGCEGLSFANQFYALAGQVRPALGQQYVRRCKHVFWKLTRQNHPGYPVQQKGASSLKRQAHSGSQLGSSSSQPGLAEIRASTGK